MTPQQRQLEVYGFKPRRHKPTLSMMIEITTENVHDLAEVTGGSVDPGPPVRLLVPTLQRDSAAVFGDWLLYRRGAFWPVDAATARDEYEDPHIHDRELADVRLGEVELPEGFVLDRLQTRVVLRCVDHIRAVQVWDLDAEDEPSLMLIVAHAREHLTRLHPAGG